MTGALANKIFTQNNFLEILIFLNFLYFPDLNKILWTQKKKKKKKKTVWNAWKFNIYKK